MKKFSITMILSVAIILTATAQVRLNFYSAYVFNDGFDVARDANNYFNGTVKGGYQWGAGIQYVFSSMSSAEILYIKQSTHSPTTFKFGTNNEMSEELDVNLNYIMLSGAGVYPFGKAEGYGGLMGGVLISNVEAPSVGHSSTNTNFAWGVRLGTNIWTSPKFGIKIQAQLLSGTKATGGETYFEGYGPVYIDSYERLWQFSIGGGLTYKLGKNNR